MRVVRSLVLSIVRSLVRSLHPLLFDVSVTTTRFRWRLFVGREQVALTHRQYVYMLHVVRERLAWPDPPPNTSSASTSTTTTTTINASPPPDVVRFVALIDVCARNSD
jgi:hypothetical protein